MSKIICDVCGTRYPESAEQCPICGRIRAGGANTASDDMLMDEMPTSSGGSYVRGGRFSKANVRKRNENLVRYEMPAEKKKPKPRPEEDDAYGVPPVEQSEKSNTGLNIALAVVIVALLCVTAYIFVEFFMPNVLKRTDGVVPTTEPAQIVTEEPTVLPTEEPTVPCTDLTIVNEEASAELQGLGQKWLLNVVVTPEDTTDQLIYASSNEDVVSVDSEGCLTATGEGQATIIVTCGNVQVSYDVVCQFQEEPTAAPEEETTAPAETSAPLKDVKLTVNLTDITFNAKNQGYTFKCGELSREEITWTSEDENVVTVKDGKAVSVGRGTTNIIAQYGDQKVTIIVRCDF